MKTHTPDPLAYDNLESYKAASVAAAESRAEAEWEAAKVRRRIKNLHTETGFASVAELIDELKKLSGSEPTTRGKAKKKRATITDKIRAKVAELAAKGMKAPSIAQVVGISPPSVYNLLSGK